LISWVFWFVNQKSFLNRENLLNIKNKGLIGENFINFKEISLKGKIGIDSWKNFWQFFLKDKINNQNNKNDDNLKQNNQSQGINEIIKNNSQLKKKKKFKGTSDIIITLINKERFDKGLKPLEKNKLLMKSAYDKAWDMKEGKYFEHINYGGIQPWFYAEKNNYHYQSFGENIAMDYFSANSVHQAFMDSIGHRKNILNTEFRDVGVAIVLVDNEVEHPYYIVVEHFGSYLKKPDIFSEKKCREKNKNKCQIQKNKLVELNAMIVRQKELRDGLTDNKSVDKNKKQLKDLLKIKRSIKNYLKICKQIRADCKG
jgi:uncharacterized protein YkwD